MNIKKLQKEMAYKYEVSLADDYYTPMFKYIVEAVKLELEKKKNGKK